MAIIIGARQQGNEIVYYAVVNGVASQKSYTGLEGRWKALVEAAGIEFNALVKELASQEMARNLALLPEGFGMTITVPSDPASRYAFTDSKGNLYAEGFASGDDVVDFTAQPKGVQKP
ncbi:MULTISPECIES: hypothetical protein [unclassified Bradyrhizobium]|uniref:hypothetical protein n=1 Tax=unclassified Bradyrhizobium TaxID=2631580 RepID=UPI0028F0BAD5|nr:MULTISPECIES: hypothetical protein [unclassified Bradyrhizobium]